mgnify:CR=1 FL=1
MLTNTKEYSNNLTIAEFDNGFSVAYESGVSVKYAVLPIEPNFWDAKDVATGEDSNFSKISNRNIVNYIGNMDFVYCN